MKQPVWKVPGVWCFFVSLTWLSSHLGLLKLGKKHPSSKGLGFPGNWKFPHDLDLSDFLLCDSSPFFHHRLGEYCLLFASIEHALPIWVHHPEFMSVEVSQPSMIPTINALIWMIQAFIWHQLWIVQSLCFLLGVEVECCFLRYNYKPYTSWEGLLGICLRSTISEGVWIHPGSHLITRFPQTSMTWHPFGVIKSWGPPLCSMWTTGYVATSSRCTWWSASSNCDL